MMRSHRESSVDPAAGWRTKNDSGSWSVKEVRVGNSGANTSVVSSALPVV